MSSDLILCIIQSLLNKIGQLVDPNDSIGNLKVDDDNSVFAIVVHRVDPYDFNVTDGVSHIAATIFFDGLLVPQF